jgi:hypothetical protein
MIYGNAGACDLVGFPQQHGSVFQQVANSLDLVIMSRSVGKSCTQLIQEGYGLKGFRIDTKSCSWGPQMGLVCMDPRLNKEGLGKVVFNTAKTIEALSGEIPHNLSEPGPGESAGWKADIVPIAISGARVRALIAGVDGKRIAPTFNENGFMRGESEHAGKEGVGGYGRVTFPWLLIRLPEGRQGRYGQITGEVWGLFVDPARSSAFRQVYPDRKVEAIYHKHAGKWYEAVLGLANPGSGSKGYKACVTGDYDLFGVWPRKAMQGHSHVRPTQTEISRVITNTNRTNFRGAAAGPRRIEENWDARPVSQGHKEHWLLGNVTPRINLVKVMLNTMLQADTAIPAFGQCVHHSDEVGNPNMELKKSLTESMPIIAFVPTHSRVSAAGTAAQKQFAINRGRRITDAGAVGIATIEDLKIFARACIDLGFALDLRPDWRGQLGFK